MAENRFIPVERIEKAIYLIRGQRVILDRDLAVLYGVTTKRLNEQVKRNLQRFPDDFMFQLTIDETKEVFASRSQFATLKRGQNIKYVPYAFTEHGALMAANVLNSPIAVDASVAVIRAFIRLRQILASHVELARKLTALEKKYDAQFKAVFDYKASHASRPFPIHHSAMSGFDVGSTQPTESLPDSTSFHPNFSVG